MPGWRKGAKAGWVTAEYAMLPASTGKRCKREYTKRKGRSMEIERLIGRSLRTVVNMKALGEYTVTVDCDVIQADGGTRTASITGAWVALHDALAMWVEAGKIERIPLTGQVAAISMGVVDGNTLLDLDYSEDSHAEVDMNLVATDTGEMIELQGTGEQAPSTASVSTPCSTWATRALPSSSSFSARPSPNLPKGDRVILVGFICETPKYKTAVD